MPQRLAIDGGNPTMTDGPFAWPLPDDDVRAALERAYADGSWGRYHGPQSDVLVERLCAWHGCDHALLCSSGTIGVEMALRGVGVAAGDRVILAGYDFPGNFRAIEAIGARPCLVDIDPANWCLDSQNLAALIGGRQINPAKIKAVLVSHLHGGLAPMKQIVELAAENGWAVVEDVCQAPGAVVEGRRVGTWGNAGVLSFGGSKLLTAGRGGALLTDDPQVAQRAKIFAERGNHAFPLSELQAAVLIPQLNKLTDRNQIRRNAAQQIADLVAASGTGWTTIPQRSGDEPVFYKMAWKWRSCGPNDVDRDRLLAALQAEGVPIDAGFRGFVDRSTRRCDRPAELTHSREAASNTWLLHHPVLLEADHKVRQVANALGKVWRALAT